MTDQSPARTLAYTVAAFAAVAVLFIASTIAGALGWLQ